MGNTEITILIIDDNETLLKAWKRILDHKNFCLFLTNSAQEGAEYLRQNKVDLLICDIVMPHMDGFDLVQVACHLQPIPKIIMTTGYVCDFHRLRPDLYQQNIHMLMKPYNNILEVGNFVERVLEENESLVPPGSLKNDPIYFWNL